MKKERIILIIKTILNCILILIIFGLPLFLPAGTFRFWNAWLFLAIFIISYFFILFYFSLKNPEYAKKRLNSEEEEKQQKIVMTLLILSFLILLCVSGFDYRFHWSHIPVFIVIVFSVVMIGGIIMLFAVMIQNIYASHSVEIQEGQRLIDTGFYSIVRHPMYLAFLIILSSSPVVLGSYYSFIPVFFIIILLTFRIRNEEEVLEKGLKGYDSYMKRVRFRLMPFIW